jgi:membrane protease subunit HflC
MSPLQKFVMKKSFTILVGVILAVVLLSRMFLYQVRYDQVAIRTLFDRADAESVEDTPGLKWRLPWPIHQVTHYSKRLQLLEDRLEELQTADGKSVIVRTYLTWRIADPLAFYVTLQDPAEARRQLASQLREVRGIISEYRLDQLVNQDRDQLAVDEIERRAQAALQDSLTAAGFGLKVENVGLYRVLLPESTTAKVFETMIATRERLAESAVQEGQAQASAIRSEAASGRDRILAFAERRAQAIRSEGDREASREYAEFAQDEEFAIFLRRLEALEQMLQHNTTFVLPAESLGILDPLARDTERQKVDLQPAAADKERP